MKYYLFVAVALVGFFLAIPSPVSAQNCPPNTTALPSPHGTYPPGNFCAPINTGQQIVADPVLVCDQGIKIENGWYLMDTHEDFIFAPDPNMNFLSGRADIQFNITLDYPIYISHSTLPSIFVHIWTYDASGVYLDYEFLRVTRTGTRYEITGEYTYQWQDTDKVTYLMSTEAPPGTWSGSPLDDPIPWYHAPATPPLMEAGGYIKMRLAQPEPDDLERYYFSGVKIADSTYDIYLLPNCGDQIEWQEPPTTPTPTPTATSTPTTAPTNTPTSTPTGTYEPTPTITPTATTPATNTPAPTTTPTYWSTSPPATPPPTSSPTPYSPVLLSPEPSATPMVPITFPTLVFATVTAPGVPSINTPPPFSSIGLTPNATSIAAATTAAGWVDSAGIITTRWYTSTNQAYSWLSVTNTNGISSPVAIADEITASIVRPISYVRALAVYMPNTWPYILIVLLLLLWIVFNLLAKYSIAIISEILELIRKLIELIPGF